MDHKLKTEIIGCEHIGVQRVVSLFSWLNLNMLTRRVAMAVNITTCEIQ